MNILHTRKWQLATLVFAALTNGSNGQACFDPPRFPRYLQQSDQKQTKWRAIEGSISLNALFVGGNVKKDSGLINWPTNDTPPDHFPVIARIDATTHYHKWMMTYYTADNAEFQMVMALALASDDNTRLAVACSKREGDFNGNQRSFVFLVDTTTGSHVGRGINYGHNIVDDKYDMFVLPNQGILMRGGKIYTTFYATKTDFGWDNKGWYNGLCNTRKRDARMRFGCFNPSTNSVCFYTESNNYGRSAALFLDTAASPEQLWLGGVTTQDEDNPAWYFALFKMNMNDGTAQQAFRFAPKQNYQVITNNEYSTIKHFAKNGNVFFGTFEFVMLRGSTTAGRVGVWKVDISTSSVIMKDHTATGVNSNYGEDKARIIGMRPTLEGDKLHMMVHLDLTDDKLYYAVVDLDPNVTIYNSYLVRQKADFKLQHATWFEPAGAPTFLLDPTNPSQVAYNSFSVGRVKPNTNDQEWGIIFGTVLSNTLSCYYQGASSSYDWVPLIKPLTLTVRKSSSNDFTIDNSNIPTFIPYTSSNFCVNQNDQRLNPWLLISSWSLKTELLYEDTVCNPTTTTMTSPGSMQGSGQFTHYLGTPAEFSFNPPTITSPTGCPNVWSYQVIWTSSTIVKSPYLSVTVDPDTNKIKVMSYADSQGNYNLSNGDSFTFTIRSSLPAPNSYSDFGFTVTINATQVCTITSPTVNNQNYTLNDPLVQFVAPDFIQTGTCSGVTISNTIPPAATIFVNNASGTGKTFTWATTNSAYIGSYPITVTASWSSQSVHYSFDLVVVGNSCTPTTFAAPAGGQVNPPVYSYGTTPSVFTFTPYTIAPSTCVPVYTCTSTPINLCSISSGSTLSSFNGSSAAYSFVSQDAQTYPPGDYTFQINVTAGAQQKTATFKLTLAYPKLVMKASPFVDVQQFVGASGRSLDFVASKLVDPINLLNQGQLMIAFFKDDATTALDNAVFTITKDALGSAVSPLKTNSVTDMALVGSYKVVYKVWVQNYPALSVTSVPFVVSIEDPCAIAQMTLNPSTFKDQTYTLGDPEIRQTWVNSQLATLSTTVACGDFTITKFMTKSGPPASNAITADLDGSVITLSTSDPLKVGVYYIYYSVALANYPSNTVTSTKPFKVVIIKLNTAPTLSALAMTHTTFFVEIQYPPADQIFSVGTPKDAESDQVSVSFANGGQTLISYDQKQGDVVVGGLVPDGSYSIQIRLTDDNKLGPLSTTYTIVINVSHAEATALPSNSTGPEERESTPTTPSTNIAAQLGFTIPVIPKQTETKDDQKKQKKEPQNPRIVLSEITAYGVIKFRFDQEMLIPKNLTMIDDTVLEVHIIQNAGNHRDLLGEVESISAEAPAINLNFTWNITDFRQTSMDLQLYFEEAYYVSTQHSMQVKVLIREFFVANQTLKTLTDDNLDLKVVCKPQMQLGPVAAAIQAASDSTDKGTKGILAANFALNILLSSALSLLWGMINGLQIMALLPLANVDMPGNAQMLFNQIYMIAAFNIINVDSITEYIANLFGLKVSSEGVSPRLQAMGFETSNTIMNLGLVFIFFLVSGFMLLAWCLLKALSKINCRKQEKIRQWERSLYNKLFWNFFLRLYLETYIDQAFVQALKIRNLKFSPRSEAVSTIFAFLIIAALVLSPLILLCCLLKNKKRLGLQSVKDKYEAAYEDVRYRHSFALAYSTIFMLKRLFFATFIMVIEKHCVLQAMLIIHLLLLGACYTLFAKPFEDPITNLQESLNDLLCVFITYCFIYFGDLVPDKKTQYLMGWFVCGCIGLIIIINLGFIVGVSIQTIKRRRKYYYRDFKSRVLRLLIRLRGKEDNFPPEQLFVRRNQDSKVEVGHEQLEEIADIEDTQGRNQNLLVQKLQRQKSKKESCLDVIDEVDESNQESQTDINNKAQSANVTFKEEAKQEIENDEIFIEDQQPQRLTNLQKIIETEEESHNFYSQKRPQPILDRYWPSSPTIESPIHQPKDTNVKNDQTFEVSQQLQNSRTGLPIDVLRASKDENGQIVQFALLNDPSSNELTPQPSPAQRASSIFQRASLALRQNKAEKTKETKRNQSAARSKSNRKTQKGQQLDKPLPFGARADSLSLPPQLIHEPRNERAASKSPMRAFLDQHVPKLSANQIVENGVTVSANCAQQRQQTAVQTIVARTRKARHKGKTQPYKF